LTEPNVATPSKAFEAMAAAWALPAALMGGTRAMRAAGRTYLPQEPKERNGAYDNRLKRTILFNGFRRTVRVLGGMPFGKPAILGEETAEAFVAMADDLDLAGRDLTAFARDLMADMLVFGKAHVLVDFPAQVVGEDGTPLSLSLAEERALNRRPYFTQISPLDLIAWRGERIGGAETLTRVRIRETATEPDGPWGEKSVERIRVVMPEGFQIWHKVEDDWRVEAELPNTLGEIALVTIHANRTGFLTALPPLEDLAWLNLRHWQSQSDQDNILHVARVPILFGAGFREGELDGAEIGPNRAISATDPQARLGFVEHSGAAIDAGRRDTQDLEARMQVMGAELLVPRPGNQTATARAIDAAESMSDLQAMVRALETGLEQAFGFAGRWLNLGKATAQVDVNQDFGLSRKDAGDLQTLLQARLAGEISRRTFLDEIKRRGILSDSLDVEEEVAQLQAGAPIGVEE
jgi:hypothetical protein